MDVAVVDLAGQRGLDQVGGDGLRLGDLLRLEAVAVQHVLEVHVAADVELHGALEADTAVLEELRHDAVGDGGTDLGLDVVADDGQAGVDELLGPLRVGGDEHRQGVDERAARVDGGLGVELVGLLGTDRQVGDDDVDLGVAQRPDHVDRGLGGLLDGLHVVLAQTVEGRAALDGDAGGRDVGDLDGAVLGRLDGVGEVGAHLGGINVEGGDELHVGDVVVTELDVHQARHLLLGGGVLVELHTLDQRCGAVAHTDDCHANLAHVPFTPCVRLFNGPSYVVACAK